MGEETHHMGEEEDAKARSTYRRGQPCACPRAPPYSLLPFSPYSFLNDRGNSG
uniref:Uncharacterized protein n=1 Tax=Picea glauca TaxID=3330 RepID=A0A101LVM4_PICGL|nr:hypothetical protein ABT39_MTgene1987 [Picea glauca]